MAALLVVAALLAIGGSFAPFSTYTSFFSTSSTTTYTGWTVAYAPRIRPTARAGRPVLLMVRTRP